MSARRAAAIQVLLALAFAGGVAIGCGGAHEAVVAGTVLDAETGEPVAHARVQGPSGTEDETDERGRFELDDLEPGTAGEVAAQAPDGRAGKLLLRPLEAGRLEVVLHLSRP